MADAEQLRAVPVRHWGRWVSGTLLVVALAWLIAAAVDSEFVDLATVRKFLFNRSLLTGLRNTIVISVLAQVIGIVLGVLLAVMRLSPNPVNRTFSGAYLWFFRGTPVLVQLLFWYNLPGVFANLTIAVPFTDVVLFTTPMTSFMTSFMAALLGLGLNEGAYMAEIVRAGILSVDDGQVEAAHALGMGPTLTMRRIVLPQAMRVIVPPTGNEFISMLKTSSLATVVLYGELLRRASDIYSTNLRTLELLVDASLWYLGLTSLATMGQWFLERHFAKGHRRG
ncbi:MAG TPA: amino acid ABC transporter permease [Acidimicrobiales bacterium]|nr:amino acid ABC transporter permease [Acidimicrobiales bacterium]